MKFALDFDAAAVIETFQKNLSEVDEEITALSTIRGCFVFRWETVEGVCGWLEENLNYWNWKETYSG